MKWSSGLHIAEEPIGIEPFVFSLIQHLTVILISTAPGRHADLHGAFAARIRTQATSGNAHLFNRINARWSEGEETRAAALEALGIVVHAIERDVERGVRQSVVRAVPLTTASRIARDQTGEVETVAAGEGQVLNQLVANRGADFIRGGVQLLGARRHLDRLRRGADLQVN